MTATLHGRTLRFERRFAHPIEKVWHVLTEERETGFWFPGRIAGPRVVGAEVTFVFEPKPSGVMADDLAALIASKQDGFKDAPPEVFKGRVLAFEPPRVFALDWAGDTLRFELTDLGGATQLVFTHTFVEADARDVGAGWHISLDWLADRAAGTPRATTRAAFEAIEAHYRAEFAVR